MIALVTLNCNTGVLRRYERVDATLARLTHEAMPASWGSMFEWEAGCVEEFRSNPDPDFAVNEIPILKPDHDAPWRFDPDNAA
jgi:hypothetical protein